MRKIDNISKFIFNKQLLFHDSNKIESINLYIYINSKNNFNNNNYFAIMILDYKNIAKWIIINILIKSEKWNQMMTIENEQLVFLVIDIDEYTKYDTEFWELILLTINWINELMRKEIEILSLLFKNKMIVNRNLIILNE